MKDLEAMLKNYQSKVMNRLDEYLHMLKKVRPHESELRYCLGMGHTPSFLGLVGSRSGHQLIFSVFFL